MSENKHKERKVNKFDSEKFDGNDAAADDIQEQKKNNKRIVFLVIAILVLVAALAYIGFYIYNNYAAEQETTTLPVSTTAAPTEPALPAAEIDFDSLKEQNDEIYAWIRIADTEVDYPIVQSTQSDEFYLKHSAYDKSWIASGAIYTEGVNKTDFSDPITVIYGHNGYKTTMFTTLHKFEDEEFFNSHPYFNIYMPQRKLTYQVISAFKYDDRHIMNSFNFLNPEELAAFQMEILSPSSPVRNTRDSLDFTIDENSKIVVLSTCITNQKSNRYLVCGVLVKDEKTN